MDQIITVVGQIENISDINYAIKELESLKEAFALVEGKWYSLGNKGTLLKYNGGGPTYGFVGGQFRTCLCFKDGARVNRLATNEEVQEAFFQEARKRYAVGDTVKDVFETGMVKTIMSPFELKFEENGNLTMVFLHDHIPNSFIVYSKGKWGGVKESITYSIGQRISLRSASGIGNEYLIAVTGQNEVALINLENGCRWASGTKVENYRSITEIEMVKITTRREFEVIS